MGWKYKLATICVCLVSSAGQASAQDAYLARIYGDGVHSYFRNDSGTAKSRFDTAINHGSRDPRAYYFRAIMELESGNAATAESDVRTGARYELEGRGTYDVWSALARVQGPHRVKFECLREEALLALRKQSVTDRYPLDFTGDDDGELLRPPADPYRTELEPNVPSITGDDPFMDDEEPPAAPTDEIEDDEAADAFEDDMEELEDDPFAEDDTLEEMDEPQPEVDTDDPFATDETPADDDPFADDASAEDDPFADDMSADNATADDATADDPFAGDAVDEAPADDAPAEEDPFGEDAMDDGSRDAPPEGDAGADDPFGDDATGSEDAGSDDLDTDMGAEEAPVEGPGDADDPFGDDSDDPFGDIFE